MIESSIARRYAKALLELGKESNKTEEYLSQLQDFFRACENNAALLETLANPFMELAARYRVVEQVLALTKADPIVRNFLKLLIKKGRMGLFETVVEAYKNYVYQLGNKVEAVITSAKPLGSSSVEEIEKILSVITRQKIVTREVIDSEVLGGVSVRVGGKVYDGTVRGALENLSREMKKTVFH